VNRNYLLAFAFIMFLAGGTCLMLALRYQFGSRSGTSENGEYSQEDELLAKLEVKKKQKKVQGVGAEEEWMTRFELIDRTEKKIGSQDLAGHIHVVSFFFATCPGTCRQQNMHIADLEREFGKQGVKFLSVSCDPDTDTPAKLREYATLFNAPKDSWYFLTGELPYIERVAAEVYGVGVSLKSHLDVFVVIDKNGKKVDNYAWANAEQFSKMKTKLRDLLKETDSETTTLNIENNKSQIIESSKEATSDNDQKYNDEK
jgi:protein SCO1